MIPPLPRRVFFPRLHVIYPAFFLCSLLDKLRLLWNVEWIHDVVNSVDSSPVAVEFGSIWPSTNDLTGSNNPVFFGHWEIYERLCKQVLKS
jgi:hypothetical protein